MVGLVYCLCLLTWIVSSYKLNVPKVLLPFQTSKVTSFVLEASNGGHGSGAADNADLNEDLCFTWLVYLTNSRCCLACFLCCSNSIFRQTTNRSSSRPEIVTIQPLAEPSSSNTSKPEEQCSRRALVSAVSTHPYRLTSTILAKETSTTYFYLL